MNALRYDVDAAVTGDDNPKLELEGTGKGCRCKEDTRKNTESEREIDR